MRFFLTFLFTLATLSAFSQEAAFRFEKETLKFEKTPEGKVMEFAYPFTNTGSSPLIINDTKVACTCTKVEFPRRPIPPGASDTIRVSFDTKGKIGYQDRTIDLISNVPGKPKSLRFKVVVDNKQD